MNRTESLDLMFEKYSIWLDKNNPLTKEEAAFEYLKRNPYFIELTSLYISMLDMFPAFTTDDKDLVSILRVRDSLKTLFSKIFLYTGFDIEQKYRVYTQDNTTDINLANFIGYDLESLSDNETYDYSAMYKSLPTLSPSQKDIKKGAKKNYPIDSGQLLQDIENKRWLEHLLPSLYVKINPYYSSSRLKSDLMKLINVISNEKALDDVTTGNKDKESSNMYYKYAMPEILINDNAKTFKGLKAPTWSTVSSISLMMYDLRYVFNIYPEELQTLLKSRFSEIEYKKYKLDNYFSASGSKDGYSSVVFEKEFNKTRTNKVLSYINGGYLELIYPRESITAHFNLIKKERLMHAPCINDSIEIQEDFWKRLQQYHKEAKHIDEISAEGVVGVRDFSKNEYRQWSKELFTLNDDSKTYIEVMRILLL